VRSGILGSLPDAMTELVDVAYMNSQRLNSLINDLLDMDKLMAGRMKFDIQPLELQSVFDDTVRTMSPYAAPLGVGIRAEGGAGLKVMADSIRIGQVLANLMSNACKFSSQGGEVLLAGREAGGMIEVSVTDRGQGIPAEFHDRIFQKFSQVDTTASRSKGGTGLGLAICKEMIERMGGRIGFESEAGKGSRFWFTLPAA
jgi:signal transduction histidine kinase